MFCLSLMLLGHLTHHSKHEHKSLQLHYFTPSLPNFTRLQHYKTFPFGVLKATGNRNIVAFSEEYCHLALTRLGTSGCSKQPQISNIHPWKQS